jgi:hypothetical protein
LRAIARDELADRQMGWQSDCDQGLAELGDQPTRLDIYNELFDASCSGRAYDNPRGYVLTPLQRRELHRIMIECGVAVPMDRDAISTATVSDRTLFVYRGRSYEFGDQAADSRAAIAFGEVQP